MSEGDTARPSTPLPAQGTRRSRPQSPVVSPSQASPPAKRQRNDEEAATPLAATVVENSPNVTDSVVLQSDVPAATRLVDAMPAALRLVEAMKIVDKLDSIGFCTTKLLQMGERMMRYGPDGLKVEDVDRDRELSKHDLEREARNAKIVAELSKVNLQHAHDVASGYLKKPFALRVTRAGCEFDGVISTEKQKSGNSTAIEARIKQWHDHADVSGYGDVREQVTKVDESVRSARDIPASEFSVEPELLERIANLWDHNFFPNEGTRVEPYKIHLYGPGDHFELHRDTPEKDLVGTFLLGLHDTSSYGGLTVNGKNMRSDQGRWCAFYPDVPHRVEKVFGGYRAVIAFKLFRKPPTDTASSKETPTTLAVRKKVANLVNRLKAPFGLMLSRKYCMGTTQFSGFDAMLYTAVRARFGSAVRHLPVALRAISTWGSHEDDAWEEYEMACYTDVYPFTTGHVDALLQDHVDFGEQRSSGRSRKDHASCGTPWLVGVENIPFFSLDLDRSLFVYSSDEVETCNYTGNEAQAWREDSLYLSYALLVLPTPDQSSDTKIEGDKDAPENEN